MLTDEKRRPEMYSLEQAVKAEVNIEDDLADKLITFPTVFFFPGPV